MKPTNTIDHTNTLGAVAAVWGVGGFILILAFAVYRLTPIALDALTYPLHWYHWCALLGNTVFMAYSEGYKGFQKGYSPRLIERARQLAQTATVATALLAPLYCMCFFAASKRRVITAWVATALIVGAVIVFHYLPQPWRGILDAGVVVGLSWGVVATIAYVLKQAPPGPRQLKK